MSYLENPFADDEEPIAEPIVSGNPFGDYDVTQRENEYNALLVQSTTLEKRLQQSDEQGKATVSDQVRKTAQLRAELGDLSLRLSALSTSAASPTDSTHACSTQSAAAAVRKARLEGASLSVLGDLEQQTASTLSKSATFTQAVRAFRRKIAEQAAPSAPNAGACDGWVVQEQHAGHTDATAHARLDFDTADIESSAQQLMDIQSRSFEDDDTGLVAAVLAHTSRALKQYNKHVHEAARLHREANRAVSAIREMELAAHLLNSFLMPKDADVASPARKGRRTENGVAAVTFEEREGEMANADLTREIQRLETVIAHWLRQAKRSELASLSSAGAEEHNAVSHAGDRGSAHVPADVAPLVANSLSKTEPSVASATATAHSLLLRDALAHETEELGKEVLFLRDVVLAKEARPENDARVTEACALVSSDGFHRQGTCQPNPAKEEDEVDLLSRRMVSRQHTLAELLQEPETPSAVGVASAADLETSVMKARIAFIEHLAPLQDACLGALRSVNEQLQKQAYGAALLTHLALHDTEFDASVVRHLGNVPPPLLPPMTAGDGKNSPSTSSEVAEWYLSENASPTGESLNQLAANLSQRLSSYSALDTSSWSARQAKWHGILRAVEDMLNLPIAAAATSAADTTSNAAPKSLLLKANTGIEAAVEAELANAEQSLDNVLANVSQALAQRRTELEKKLSWFSKQPQAVPFKDLRTVEKECTSLASRLKAFQHVAESAEKTHAQLPVLQQKLTHARESLSSLEAEAVGLEKETQTIRDALRALGG